MNYSVIGSDGKEYGPVDLATLTLWAAEGRIRPNTEIIDHASGQKRPASDIPGVLPPKDLPPILPTPATTPAVNHEDQIAGATKGVVRLANWMYWFVGMSLLNWALMIFHSNVRFMLSIGLVDGLLYLGNKSGGVAAAVESLVAALILMALAWFGYQAGKRKVWAFIAGISIITFDALILLLALPSSIISIALHIWAIYSLVLGMKLANRLNAYEEEVRRRG